MSSLQFCPGEIAPLPRASHDTPVSLWIDAVQACIGEVLSACEVAASIESAKALPGCAASPTPQWPHEWPASPDSESEKECAAYARKVADMVTLLRQCLKEHLELASHEENEDDNRDVAVFCRKMREVKENLYEADFELTFTRLTEIEESEEFEYIF